MNVPELKTLFQSVLCEEKDDLKFHNIEVPKHFLSFFIKDDNVIAHTVDTIYTWSVQEQPTGSEITLGTRGTSEDLKETFPLTKTEAVRRVVQAYLNREDVSIDVLGIENHPHGLEQCVPLKVRNFKWKMSICSSRYDYTTWFVCLRNYPIDTVDIEWNIEDNTIFSEDVINSARNATFKTRIPLPIQAIMNFKISNLKLEQDISSDDLVKLCRRWFDEEKPVGSRIEINMTSSEINLLRSRYSGEYSMDVDLIADGELALLLMGPKSRMKIDARCSGEVFMEVVE